MGMTSTSGIGAATDSSMSGGPQVKMRGPGAQKVVLNVRKLQDAPMRLLKERDILEI